MAIHFNLNTISFELQTIQTQFNAGIPGDYVTRLNNLWQQVQQYQQICLGGYATPESFILGQTIQNNLQVARMRTATYTPPPAPEPIPASAPQTGPASLLARAFSALKIAPQAQAAAPGTPYGLPNSANYCYNNSVFQFIEKIPALRQAFEMEVELVPESPNAAFVNFMHRFPGQQVTAQEVATINRDWGENLQQPLEGGRYGNYEERLGRNQQCACDFLERILNSLPEYAKEGIQYGLLQTESDGRITQKFAPVMTLTGAEQNAQGRFSLEETLKHEIQDRRFVAKPNHLIMHLARNDTAYRPPYLLRSNNRAFQELELTRVLGNSIYGQIPHLLRTCSEFDTIQLGPNEFMLRSKADVASPLCLWVKNNQIGQIGEERFWEMQGDRKAFTVDLKGTHIGMKNNEPCMISGDFNLTIPGRNFEDRRPAQMTIDGAICHFGEEYGGHYIACMRDPNQPNTWWHYDDADVSRLTDQQAHRLLQANGFIFYARHTGEPARQQPALPQPPGGLYPVLPSAPYLDDGKED